MEPSHRIFNVTLDNNTVLRVAKILKHNLHPSKNVVATFTITGVSVEDSGKHNTATYELSWRHFVCQQYIHTKVREYIMQVYGYDKPSARALTPHMSWTDKYGGKTGVRKLLESVGGTTTHH